MASSGAGVLATRSIEVARSHNVRLHVRSTFEEGEGHVDPGGGRAMLEKALISGVVHQREETVYRVDGAQAGAALRRARRGGRERRHDRADGRRDRLLRPGRGPGRRRARRSTGSASPGPPATTSGKVSLVGAGMKSHPGVAAKTFATLEARRDRGGDRLDLADQDRLPRPVRPTSTAPCRLSTRRSSLANRPRIGVVGATGAVGDDHARSSCASAATTTCASSRPRARPGTELRRLDRRGGDAGGARRRRPRPLPLLGRHLRQSRELVPHAVRGGAVAIDKSAAYRLEPTAIPLVVPEVNGSRAARARRHRREPELLHDPAHLRAEAAARCGRRSRRVRVATYQSVSGAGAQRDGAAPRGSRRTSTTCGMDWDFDGEEFDEEAKLRAETRKIMELPDAAGRARRACACRCMVGHAEAVWIETERAALARSDATAILAGAPAVAARGVPDAGRGRRAATTCSSAGSGRTRRARTASRSSSSCDNLRKGAALNAIQIAELLLEHRAAAAA